MKKNKMLRIASVLLIVTILSTVAISGTFAKYITKYDGGDDARVAKFGFVITESGSLFKTAYDVDDNTATVRSSNAEKVVAPGTSVNDYQLSIDGIAEVTTKLTVSLTGSQDVMLPAGTYADMTTANNANDTFTTDIDYTPVKFTVGASGSIGGTNLPAGFNLLNATSLTDFQYAIDNDVLPTTLNATYGGASIRLNTTTGDLEFTIPAGKEVHVTFTGGWEWAFERDDTVNPFLGLDHTNGAAGYIPANVIDKCDTYLGWDAAQAAPQYNTLDFTFTATATQVD